MHSNIHPYCALARFDRDVLAQVGVKYLIILESINDIERATDPRVPSDIVSAQDLIAGLSQLTERAHVHGIRVVGAALTPISAKGAPHPGREVLRQAVNQWIRTTNAFDGIVNLTKRFEIRRTLWTSGRAATPVIMYIPTTPAIKQWEMQSI